MSTLDAVPLSIHAACRFDASAAAFFVQRGFDATAITDNGAGDFTLTLSQPIDALESFPAAVLNDAQAAGGGSISVATVSDTQIRVTTSNGTALADLDFSIVIHKLAG